MEKIVERYRSIRSQIETTALECGRKPSQVTLIAVSKKKPIEQIEALYKIGHRDFGENYVQELLAKSEEAAERGLTEIRWHFIGHLQSNKVKSLLPVVSWIHSVDSLKLLQEIHKRASATQAPPRLLIEVNLDGQNTKSGVKVSEVDGLITESKKLSPLRIEGFMAIPDPLRAGGPRSAFHSLAALARKHHFAELSMGMTSDFRDAIIEGSTFVRVGTAIFGERG